ncbi:GNAT family N-acetyltransferase [Paenibacillus sp. sptzw28]|uniref:GNAT family N-acetyltransferase n=1 Tax=Paenibacillus sp. sptzw28 TaxID=715179 RepID=UPI001C6ED793|nr:GNAT family N-acetyltransferase [Paenibacillus sp. sptzw28]QYR22449.1 GNAT family N-acetyltransferase [Paenibacillus sp. sptzw28]
MIESYLRGSHFHVRNIVEAEFEEVSSVLKEAALWLKSEGQEMWKEDQISIARLYANYKTEEIYIGRLGGMSAAVMILQEEDAFFWPNAIRNESFYVHKLAIRRDFAKTGLSNEMINWAKAWARAKGKKYLRLDCAADRPKLCGFYEKNGFKRIGETILFDKYPTAFYEFEA